MALGGTDARVIALAEGIGAWHAVPGDGRNEGRLKRWVVVICLRNFWRAWPFERRHPRWEKRQMRIGLGAVVFLSAVLAFATGGGADAKPARAGANALQVHVRARVTQGPWSATLKPSGVLQVPRNATQDTVPVINGDTLAFVSGSSVYAYSKRAGGWSGATPGVYTLPENQSDAPQFSFAVGDGLVVFSEFDPHGPPVQPAGCSAPVFTAGSGGFSGTMTPAACLDFPPFAGSAVAAGTDAIVGSAFVSSSPQFEVFPKPAGGWSGTIAPAARLQASDGATLKGVAMSGTTVAAVGNGRAVYLFTEPAGGWSGVIHESARIPIADVNSVALSGDMLTVVADDLDGKTSAVYVMHRPAAGWQTLRRPQPRAFLPRPAFANSLPELTPASVAGGMVALSGDVLDRSKDLLPHASDFCSNGERCLAIWAIEGLSSAATAPRQLAVSAAADATFTPILCCADVASGPLTQVTTDGSTVVLAGASLPPTRKFGTALYSVLRTAPARVTRATLAGLSVPKSHPELRLTAAVGRGSSRLASLRVLIPRALGGSDLPRTLRLGPSKRTATVTLHGLHVSAALQRAIGRIAVHGGRVTLTVPVQLKDTAGHTSQSQVTLSITRS